MRGLLLLLRMSSVPSVFASESRDGAGRAAGLSWPPSTWGDERPSSGTDAGRQLRAAKGSPAAGEDAEAAGAGESAGAGAGAGASAVRAAGAEAGAEAGAGLTEDVGAVEGLGKVEGLAEGLGVDTGGEGVDVAEGLGLGAGEGLAADLGVGAELLRKDGPGLFGRLRSKLRPPPNDRPPAGARPVDSPEPSRGEDGCEGCEPSSLSEPSSSPPRPEPKPPMTSGMRSLGEYACHERVLALARRVQSEAGAGSSAAAREPNDGCVPRSRVVEWRACARVHAECAQ